MTTRSPWATGRGADLGRDRVSQVPQCLLCMSLRRVAQVKVHSPTSISVFHGGAHVPHRAPPPCRRNGKSTVISPNSEGVVAGEGVAEDEGVDLVRPLVGVDALQV